MTLQLDHYTLIEQSDYKFQQNNEQIIQLIKVLKISVWKYNLRTEFLDGGIFSRPLEKRLIDNFSGVPDTPIDTSN